MEKIRLLCMDVDGTLTDGKIYMGSGGELCKAFDVKDGYGIHEILPQYGIIPVIITGRSSQIVANRAAELGIDELYQGYHDKLPILQKLVKKYGCSCRNVAYIGDDVLDMECMKACGVCGCPADAHDDVKAICDYVCQKSAGNGAVREFIEWLCKEHQTFITAKETKGFEENKH